MKIFSKTLIGALMLATVVPVAATPAFAQSRGEVNRSEREVRQEQRQLQRERQQLQDARRFGDRRDVREQRRDVRDARQEYREDLRDYRQYRGTNRQAFRGPAFRSNFRYQQFRPGVRIAPNYYGQRYVVNNFRNYRLPNPGARQVWVRHYNDILLVNARNGTVVRVIRNFYW